MELRDEVYAVIIERLSELTGKPLTEFSENTNTETDLGLKSASLVYLCSTLEDKFEIDIDFMKIAQKKLIGQMTDYIVYLCEC